ncbi:MAG: SDR family NAD(P)-dependent oxidoreductase [Gammaproteobacteria bacterium]
MQDFNGRLAVVTGAGSGMGRELAVQLATAGCHLGLCDIALAPLEDTRAAFLAAAAAAGLSGPSQSVTPTVSIHRCDVSSEAEMLAFRDAVIDAHNATCVHLLFNNAGIGGGGSFLLDDRSEWERTFGVCWYGVYFGARAFMPLLVAAPEAHIVNTSSVNGFWATLGPNTAHTAYSAAKFAVKGFTEALINDCRLHAPHVKVSLVMPGHIGTSIGLNTNRVLRGHGALEMTAEEVAVARARMAARGAPVDNLPDDHIRAAVHQAGLDFRDKAPLTAAQAATIILDGVRAERWRILVGEDAKRLDAMVRAEPEAAYEVDFTERLRDAGAFNNLIQSTRETSQSD